MSGPDPWLGLQAAMPDPLAGLRPLVEGVGGLDESDRVRRGMRILAVTPRPPVGRAGRAGGAGHPQF